MTYIMYINKNNQNLSYNIKSDKQTEIFFTFDMHCLYSLIKARIKLETSSQSLDQNWYLAYICGSPSKGPNKIKWASTKNGDQ